MIDQAENRLSDRHNYLAFTSRIDFSFHLGLLHPVCTAYHTLVESVNMPRADAVAFQVGKWYFLVYFKSDRVSDVAQSGLVYGN